MKSILLELKTFIKKDFHLPAYGFTVIFLALVLVLNYIYNFEKDFISSYYVRPIGFLVYFLYYALPYFFVVFVVLLLKKRLYKLQSREFWIKGIVFIGAFSVTTAFSDHRLLAHYFSETADEYNYLLRVFSNLKRLIPFLVIFGIVKYIYDRKDTHLYGLRFTRTNFRPYFIMLLLVAPLVAAASFTPSFIEAYPRFKHWYYDEVFGMSDSGKILFFELAYGLDFVNIEFFFRGALIVGMARCLKEDSVLPMAALYVIIHFGKPPLEAISSFFGGFILGVHSYYTKHIMGGIMVHIGLAWMMELAAHIQHFYK